MKRSTLSSGRLSVSVLLITTFLPILGLSQVSSYQVGGTLQQVGHDVTIQSNFANCADKQDNSPSASVSVSGPPCPLDSTIDNRYGSASATTSTNISPSGNTLSFSAHSFATASSVDPTSIYGGMHSFASQGGSYYSFVLDHSSYVEFNATFNPSFSGDLAHPGKGSSFANISVNAGSPGGGIPRDGNNVPMQLFGSATGSGSLNSVTVHTAPVLLGPGEYFIQGGTSATADTGQSASADVTVSITVQASNMADPIGSFTCADGTVTITAPGGSPVAATIGTPVHIGDVIQTGANSRACILLIDNTTFIISGGANLTVDQYVYDPNNSTNNSARYSMVAGAFQYLSGLVAKKTNPDVHIDTPVGCICIRGTELIGTYEGTSQTVYLAEGEVSVIPNHTATPVIYDAQTVITFDGSSASTSPFSQDAYNQLKAQITGVSPTNDTQPPTINCASPPNGWQGANVTIACTASDTGSGLANSADANFTLTTSVATGTETANASTNSHQVCDKANNCATAGPIGGIMIDLKAPVITITAPANNGSFLMNAAVPSNYQCTDGGSGVQSCAGPVAGGASFDTATVGAKTFTVNAKDNAGNTSSASASYSVGYGVCLLFDNTRAVKSGSTLPLKLALCDANNNDVSTSTVVVHATSLVQVSSNASYNIEDAGSANPDSDFRFDPTVGSTGGYTFNLKTTGLTTGTYRLSFTAGTDPTAHAVNFQVR